jgi:hypothetical protein
MSKNRYAKFLRFNNLIYLFFEILVDEPPACGNNEEYSECGANGCQNTCENPTLSQVCRAMCIAGCVCKEGYLRDSNGNCVAAKKCPQGEFKFLNADLIVMLNSFDFNIRRSISSKDLII